MKFNLKYDPMFGFYSCSTELVGLNISQSLQYFCSSRDDVGWAPITRCMFQDQITQTAVYSKFIHALGVLVQTGQLLGRGSGSEYCGNRSTVSLQMKMSGVCIKGHCKRLAGPHSLCVV
jgi:hypothetical protein